MINWEDRFKEKANIKHDGKYTYCHVNYINAHSKVFITCPIHGDFEQTPNAHLNGQGCPKCNGGVLVKGNEFIERAKQIHKNEYGYSKVKYVNSRTKVCIICPKHGEFYQTPNEHLSHGCPYCSNRAKYTTETFISKCKEKYGNEFIDYSKVEYINRNTNILLLCKKCGKEFYVNPHNHLKRGDGCQYCKMSKLEKEVYKKLKDSNILFEWHKWFTWMNNGKSHKSLDFYLPEYNTAIECQGVQHFKEIEYFGGEKSFKKQKENDLVKFSICENHGIKILYYSDKRYNDNIITDLDVLIKEVSERNK